VTTKHDMTRSCSWQTKKKKFVISMEKHYLLWSKFSNWEYIVKYLTLLQQMPEHEGSLENDWDRPSYRDMRAVWFW